MEARHKREVQIQFGKRLSALRKKKKLSFRKLADRCDVDFSDIQKYEKGLKDLRLATIVELATGLGVHPSELLNFDFEFLKK
jgi:transcriptional regulator with XRE-family HTH domain